MRNRRKANELGTREQREARLKGPRGRQRSDGPLLATVKALKSYLRVKGRQTITLAGRWEMVWKKGKIGIEITIVTINGILILITCTSSFFYC